MDELEAPPTDSGYPTPRDDIPTSSRSVSPTQTALQLTSTPIRTTPAPRRSLKNHFSSFREDLSAVEASNTSLPVSNNSSILIEIIKPLLEVTREMKSLKKENESLREESKRLLDESISYKNSGTLIPKLVFPPEMRDIKKENVSSLFVKDFKNPEEIKMQNPNIITATATIQVEQEKSDADVQTDTIDETERVFNTSLQLEVENLALKLENTEKEKINLQNRLFDYEKMRAKFEENEQKLKENIDALNSKRDRSEKRVADLESRLNTLRKENQEIRDENQKLVEYSKVHDFEIDELKIQVDASTQEIVEKNGAILKIESLLEEERAKNKGLVEENRQKVEELTKKIENILAKELSENEKMSMIMKESEELKSRNAELEKENLYLENAKTELMEAEMGMKRDLAELVASLRSVESKLGISERNLKSERDLRKEADKMVGELGLQVSQLERAKFESEELMIEVKKGKEEIDFLRNELGRRNDESEEMVKLRKELMVHVENSEKLRDELAKREEKEAEMNEKLESVIREAAASENELGILKNEKENLEQNLEEMTASNKMVNVKFSELSSKYKLLEEDYHLYMKNAIHEFHTTVGEKDEEISHLRARLVELETYPGQTISIQKRNQMIQTDQDEPAEGPSSSSSKGDVSPDRSRSSVGSLISNLSEKSSIESRISRIHDKLDECMKRDLDSSNCYRICCDVGNQVVELIDALLLDSQAPVATAGRFWDSIKKIVKRLESEWKGKLEKCNIEKEEIGRNIERLQEEIGELKDELHEEREKLLKEADENVRLLQENTDMEDEIKVMKGDAEEMKAKLDGLQEAADWFREEYEKYYKGVEVRNEEIEKLEEERIAKEGERVLLEEECKMLRERLDSALHDIQIIRRGNIETGSVHDDEIENLRRAIEKANNDVAELRRNLELAKENNRILAKKKKYADETVKEMKEAFEMSEKRAVHLRARNTERQKLIEHMMKGVRMAQQDSGKLPRILNDLSQRVQKSGLLFDDSDHDISLSLPKNDDGPLRRVLQNRNND